MRRLTLMLVGTMALGSAGVFALACSSDPAQLPPGDDDDDSTSSSSGKTGSSSGSSGGNTSSSGGSSGNTSSSGGSSGTSGGPRPCDFTKVKLRPTPTEGAFCPFQENPDGGEEIFGACAIGSTCCTGNRIGDTNEYNPTECKTGDSTACTAVEQTGWQCGEKSDCTGADVCCFQPNPDGQGTIDIDGTRDHDEHGTCPAIYGAYGTRCEASCGAGKFQACQTNEECGAGKTCNVRKTGPGFTMQIGVCE